MATKTSKLHTSFTGDDKQFQRTAGRVMKSGTQMGAMAGRLKGAFAAMGGAMVLSGIIDKFDRIGKVATRVGMSAEDVQRLAHAADLTGTNFETLQGIMTRLQRRIGEALQNPASAAAQAFDELGLSALKLRDDMPLDQVFAIADAFKATGAGVEGTASLMKLLDTEVRNMIPMLLEGSEGIKEMMTSATVASEKTVEELQKVKDKLTELSNLSSSTFANMFIAIADGAMAAGEEIGKLAAKIETKMPLWAIPSPAAWGPALIYNTLFGGSEFTGAEISAGIEAREQQKQGEKDRKEKGKDDAKARKAEEAENKRREEDRSRRKALWMTGPGFQGRMKKAFAEDEDPFAETLALLEEKWKPSELAKTKEAEQKILSGQFSEFMQTAGLGGTGYLRKTPEIVQLEKQTKISESMLQSINDFNSSMGILVENTVDR